MAKLPHVANLNPYHLSFINICSSSTKNNESSSNTEHCIGKVGNVVGKFSNNYRDTYYDEYLKQGAEFYCDLCDRSFRNKGQLEFHNSEHITCGRDGCKFTAHRKVVDNHVRVQHATGIFSKIKKLDNPEEVKKWLEERKKKYPTRKTVMNKVKLNDAKKERGEIIETNRSNFNKDFVMRNSRGGRNNMRGRGRAHGRSRGQERKGRSQPQTQRRNPQPSPQCEPIENMNGNIPAFPGVGTISSTNEDDVNETEVKDFNISDEDELVNQNKTAESASAFTNKSLVLLMAAYDSDASDGDIEVKPPPPPSINVSSLHHSTQPVVTNDDDAPDEIPTVKSSDPSTPIETKDVQRHPVHSVKGTKRPQQNNSANKKPGPIKRPRKPTLLQSLLSSEINRERSIIRDCINHVVRNSFFIENKMETKRCASDNNTKKGRKSQLLKGLLRDEILHERNLIMQCVRQVVNNNFFNIS